MSCLILPGNPLYDLTLGLNLPPALAGSFFVARAGSGLLEAVSEKEFNEYLHGGEYDQRLAETEEDDEWDGSIWGG